MVRFFSSIGDRWKTILIITMIRIKIVDLQHVINSHIEELTTGPVIESTWMNGLKKYIRLQHFLET
tara:strand:- start:782 stop:979 length:198 start_codon:yes stop_codon:yes gene_type:complete